MRCFVLDGGHGCYKRGYDVLKLAGAVLFVGRVARIAAYERKASPDAATKLRAFVV